MMNVKSLPFVRMVHSPCVIGQFLRYGMVGGAGLVLHTLVFAGLNETTLPSGPGHPEVNYYILNALAFPVSSIVVLILNKRWVFSQDDRLTARQVVGFYLVALFAWIIGTQIGVVLMSMGGLNEYVALMGTMATSVLINFVGRRHLVFGTKSQP